MPPLHIRDNFQLIGLNPLAAARHLIAINLYGG
jgi:hypothetical protein